MRYINHFIGVWRDAFWPIFGPIQHIWNLLSHLFFFFWSCFILFFRVVRFPDSRPCFPRTSPAQNGGFALNHGPKKITYNLHNAPILLFRTWVFLCGPVEVKTWEVIQWSWINGISPLKEIGLVQHFWRLIYETKAHYA